MQRGVILVHHNCEQLVGMGQGLFISCKMNIEEKIDGSTVQGFLYLPRRVTLKTAENNVELMCVIIIV